MSENQTIQQCRSIIYNRIKLHRFLPKFIIRYLRRILHEEEINVILNDVKGINELILPIKQLRFQCILHYEMRKIFKRRQSIIVSNHPLGGLTD